MSTGCSPTSSRIRISAVTSSSSIVRGAGLRRRRAAWALAALGTGLLAAGCGKKGPPMAPLRTTPVPPGVLRVRQIGKEVVLSTTLNLVRSDGAPLGPGAFARVLRMPATGTLRPGAVSDRYMVQQFEKQAAEIRRL